MGAATPRIQYHPETSVEPGLVPELVAEGPPPVVEDTGGWFVLLDTPPPVDVEGLVDVVLVGAALPAPGRHWK